MIVWRVSNHAILDGAGGLYASGRWHNRGRRIVYCAENPATALLETLVHLEVDEQDISWGDSIRNATDAIISYLSIRERED